MTFSSTAPAYQHATRVAVYPALFKEGLRLRYNNHNFLFLIKKNTYQWSKIEFHSLLDNSWHCQSSVHNNKRICYCWVKILIFHWHYSWSWWNHELTHIDWRRLMQKPVWVNSILKYFVCDLTNSKTILILMMMMIKWGWQVFSFFFLKSNLIWW